MSNHKGWIGVDLDGTLAEYTTWKGSDHIGAPIPKMLERVKAWLAIGQEVRIFTARVSPAAAAFNNSNPTDIIGRIRAWCVEHVGRALAVTHEKDMAMIQLWDDRAVQIIPNTGDRADELRAVGTEAAVCEDIARRQQLGIKKYGTTVAENPLSLKQWLQHAYEESLDHAVYLKRAISEIKE
jgi:hypothetical protein